MGDRDGIVTEQRSPNRGRRLDVDAVLLVSNDSAPWGETGQHLGHDPGGDVRRKKHEDHRGRTEICLLGVAVADLDAVGEFSRHIGSRFDNEIPIGLDTDATTSATPDRLDDEPPIAASEVDDRVVLGDLRQIQEGFDERPWRTQEGPELATAPRTEANPFSHEAQRSDGQVEEPQSIRECHGVEVGRSRDQRPRHPLPTAGCRRPLQFHHEHEVIGSDQRDRGTRSASDLPRRTVAHLPRSKSDGPEIVDGESGPIDVGDRHGETMELPALGRTKINRRVETDRPQSAGDDRSFPLGAFPDGSTHLASHHCLPIAGKSEGNVDQITVVDGLDQCHVNP